MTNALSTVATKRIMFFLQGQKIPSSRFRVGQFISHFRSNGIDCTLRTPYPSLHGHVNSPLVHGVRRQLTRPCGSISRLRQLGGVRDHDLIYLQRPMLSYYTTILEEFVCRMRPAIFDIDDAIFHNFFGLERLKIGRIVSLCQHVIAGNDYLAERLKAPGKTTVIPTVVDIDRFTVRPSPRGPYTIVWTGIGANLKELRPIVTALTQTLAQTQGRLLIVTDRIDEDVLRNIPYQFVKWSPATEVSALESAHVGIMPLRDTAYNRGKCGFKLIQYMARGIPVVASAVGANNQIVRDGIDGFLVRESREWVNALVDLSKQDSSAMGAAGRRRVESNYSIEAVLPTYLRLFEKIGR